MENIELQANHSYCAKSALLISLKATSVSSGYRLCNNCFYLA